MRIVELEFTGLRILHPHSLVFGNISTIILSIASEESFLNVTDLINPQDCKSAHLLLKNLIKLVYE